MTFTEPTRPTRPNRTTQPTRTTRTPVNVPQLMLPGQAAAPEGPVQAMPMYLMHHAFRRDLAAFAAAVPLTPVEDRATWRRLRDRWELFAKVLHKHHSGEDAGLWPLLLERVDAAGDVEGRRTLEAMEAEHGDIDPTLRACEDGFTRLAQALPVEEAADARAALAVRLVAAREGLGKHLEHEERDAMALVQRHMTQDDWDAMVAEHFDKGMTARDRLQGLPWVAHGMTPAALEQVAALAGRAVVVVWRLALKRPFERRERAAFRYLPAGA